MPRSVTVRNLPEKLVRQIKARAVENKRSMEEEIRETLRERYLREAEARKALRRMRKNREELARKGLGLDIPPDEFKEWCREGLP